MTDAGEHHCALLDVALNAGSHIQKCISSGPHLDRAPGGIIHVVTATESFGSARQFGHRTQLIAQIDTGNYRHEHAKKYHIYQ